MSYIFKNTEINNKKATTFETKSLLYLIGKSSNRKQIQYVAFDCFNDVNGIDKKGKCIWDIQSKNEANLNPKKIGRYFYTLFANSISSFNFKEYIFFCPPLKDDYKIDSSIRVYKFSNFVEKTAKKIRLGLSDEIMRVMDDKHDYSSEIDKFLDELQVVEDNFTEQEYLKSITKFKDKSLKSDEFYESVFIDLRDKQAAKKNSYIENQEIFQILDVIKFQRHLEVLDIEKLIICRIIGTELFQYRGIPRPFLDYVNSVPREDQKDLLETCNANIARCLFLKTQNNEFWKIFETIISYLNTYQKETDVENIFVENFKNYVIKYNYLDDITIKYLISVILEGLQ